MTPETLFDATWTKNHFPLERTDAFFDALFGDAEEGAYTISLQFKEVKGNTYFFTYDLHQRADKCLVCSLTYGLPQVFARHPVINVKGLVSDVATALGRQPDTAKWQLGGTKEHSTAHHSIELAITFE